MVDLTARCGHADEGPAQAVSPQDVLPLGDMLAQLSRDLGLANDDFASFEEARGQMPAEPMAFE